MGLLLMLCSTAALAVCAHARPDTMASSFASEAHLGLRRSLVASSTRPRASGVDILDEHYEFGTDAVHFNWTAPSASHLDYCPKWIKDYVVFHKQARGKEGAKYIINACLDKDQCTHGVGDRLRGLLPTFQLAKAHNRVLLITWPAPHPLETFLEPRAMDWRLTPELDIDLAKATRINPNKVSPDYVDGAEDEEIWTIDTNRMVYDESAEVPEFKQVSWESHCIHRLLFKPTAELTHATDQVQRQLLGNLDKPFVAVHLRLGHQRGENKDLPRPWDHFEGLIGSYKCAMERDALLYGDSGFLKPQPALAEARSLRQLRASKGSSVPPQPRVLVLTDHEHLRDMVAEGMLLGATGPSYIAHHFSYSKDLRRANVSHKNITMSIFVDLMLLARARCLVWSKSGYNKFAMAYSWTPCTAQLDYCINEMFEA